MRDKIKLVSTGKTKLGKVTGTFRTTTKNKKRKDYDDTSSRLFF